MRERSARGQDLCRQAASNHLSPFENDRFLANFDGFPTVVRDVKNRQVEFPRQNFQLLENGAAQLIVETSERFIEQEQAGLGKKRASNGYPLPFPAGKIPHAAGENGFDPQKTDNMFKRKSRVARFKGPPVKEISADIKVWKQRIILRDIADAPFSHDQGGGSVGESDAIKAQQLAFGRADPGDAFKKRSLARPGGTEDRGAGRVHFEIELQIKIGKLQPQVAHFQFHRVSLFRSNHSPAKTVANAIRTHTKSKR